MLFTVTAPARPLDKEVSALVALVDSNANALDNNPKLAFVSTRLAFTEDTSLIRLLISDARPTDNDVSALVALVLSVTTAVDNDTIDAV